MTRISDWSGGIEYEWCGQEDCVLISHEKSTKEGDVRYIFGHLFRVTQKGEFSLYYGMRNTKRTAWVPVLCSVGITNRQWVADFKKRFCEISED